jgi:hypothetical protein
LAIFSFFSQQGVSAISFEIQLKETSPNKQKEHRQKQLGADKLVTTHIWKLKNLMSLFCHVFSLPVHFEFFAIFSCVREETAHLATLKSQSTSM